LTFNVLVDPAPAVESKTFIPWIVYIASFTPSRVANSQKAYPFDYWSLLSLTKWKLLKGPALETSNLFIYSSSHSRGSPPTKTLKGVSCTYVETIPKSTTFS
jgi:hypothetical protein